ncbi:hypothetical protein BDW02DRAFT_108886 [Decorospora gaudefroyi]|uniref:RING-type domain-containing protein n=1 Tax=Decorospora gaudefroyi TaxID=184978 RepID=A0A6A5KPW5_9PLEO|nr:hypothetical protein BDW02DRAFT_108886 [Decorospora gaudefroyi]
MPLSSFPSLSNNTSNAVRSLKVLKQSKIVPLPTASPDEACCICLNLYGPSHKAVTVLIKDCYHRFGQGCLNEYLDSNSPRSNTCPQCRREWYTRQSSWSTPRDTNITEALTALSLPRAPARVEPRTRVPRMQRRLDIAQVTNNSVINGHLDEVFRRLDLIQDISSEQVASGADTRVRLQAVERRARRIYQELEPLHGDSDVQAPANSTLRGHEIRRRLGQSSVVDTVSRRRWMEAFEVELDDDPYSLMGGANRSRASLPRIVPTADESRTTTETSSNALADVHPALRSSTSAASFNAPGTTRDQRQESNCTRGSSTDEPQGATEPLVLSRAASNIPSDLQNISQVLARLRNSTSPDVETVHGPLPRHAAANLDTAGSEATVCRRPDTRSTIQNPHGTQPVCPGPAGFQAPTTRDASSGLLVARRPHISNRARHDEMHRRALTSFQTSLAAQAPGSSTPTPALSLSAPSRRRFSLGDLVDSPPLRAPPAANSRHSLSTSGRNERNNGQSQRNSAHWLRLLPQVSNLASLREVLLPTRSA